MVLSETMEAKNSGVEGHGDKGGPVIAKSHIDSIKVEMEAFLGHAKMMISEVENLRKGDIISLDQSLNASIELRVNNIAVARGEIVAVGDRFGVRIIELSDG